MRRPVAATPAPGATGNGRLNVMAGRLDDVQRIIIPDRIPQARRRRLPRPGAMHPPTHAGGPIVRARHGRDLDALIARTWCAYLAELLDWDTAGEVHRLLAGMRDQREVTP
jgi:hypothetical protein